MVEKDKAAPLRRPRAPTITLDTSAVSEQHGKINLLLQILLLLSFPASTPFLVSFSTISTISNDIPNVVTDYWAGIFRIYGNYSDRRFDITFTSRGLSA